MIKTGLSTNICCILLVTCIQLLFAYPENDILLVIPFLSRQTIHAKQLSVLSSPMNIGPGCSTKLNKNELTSTSLLTSTVKLAAWLDLTQSFSWWNSVQKASIEASRLVLCHLQKASSQSVENKQYLRIIVEQLF